MTSSICLDPTICSSTPIKHFYSFLNEIFLAIMKYFYQSKYFQVTTLTPRLSAKLSTSALLTELEVWPSTASSVPTVLSSTRTTSSATGGSTSTAPPLRSSTPSTTRSLQRGKLWLERHPTPLETMQLLLLSTVLRDPELLSTRLLPGGDVSRVAEGGRAKHPQLAPNVPSPLVT